jgi:ribosome-associated protein
MGPPDGSATSGDAQRPGRLRVDGTCVIDASEVTWRFTPSGGPGGQHANKASTRAEARFDVAASPSLTASQRDRLLDALGPKVVVVVDETRSQARNRDLALERLVARLATGLHRDPPRKRTKPSKAAKARRVDEKRRRSDTKRDRARPRPED